ncbi:perilipin-2 isoform X2 [Alosa sapidissima]|uniref:perilipin-2 isoform X2 n=1 Tax=Alosa sapidissima TaxID=34773 RepID=UPI001C085854|nr:perilipin-2 isoform X2 [Alosa sapidissima]
MASMVLNDQNVVSRVASLPLVSSAYDIMSKVYLQTKDQHPYIKSVCEVAELGVKTVSSVAIISALPIIDKLEPQLTIANVLACKGLDKIEKSLPILHQPSEQVVASAKDTVNGAKDVVSERVNGAKETVTSAVTGMVGRTRGAVQGGVSMVKESRVVQLVSCGVDSALSTSESLVEQYLPHTNQEMKKSIKAVESFENGLEPRSYYTRLGSLSTKVGQRTYQRTMAKIEYARKNLDNANQKMHVRLTAIMDWRVSGQTSEECDAVSIESRTLALARGLSQQLQTTCQGLVSSVQGLPQNIQDQALTLSHLASELYGSFSKAAAIGDLSDSVLSSSRTQLHRVRVILDDTMDYLVNNTPLNWLVGPFYSHMEPPAGGRGGCSGAAAHSHDASANNTHKQPELNHAAVPSQTSTEERVCDTKAKKHMDSTH